MLALRPRAARADAPETEVGVLTLPQRLDQTPRRAPLRGVTRGDAGAILGLVALSLALFGPHILGITTFVGSSDRLHNFLNMRQLAVDALQATGRVPAWSDTILLGFPVFGVHWIMLALDPASAVMALFPAREVFRVAGYISALHLVAGALSAYLLARDVVRAPFPAFVAAALYVCSAFSIQWIGQDDAAFAAFIFQPLGILLLRRLRSGSAAPTFLGLTAVVVALVWTTQLQAAAYILIFFGIYACYRALAVRDWRPFVVLGAAGLVGILLTAPRLGTVMEDFRELSRGSSIQSTCPCELLRWFDEGIFGRHPQEALALGNDLNLYEGLQLYTSTFAAAGVIAMLLRPRGGPAQIAGVSFVLLLTMLFLPVIGLGRSGLLVLTGAGTLTLWALLRRGIGRRLGMPERTFVQDPDVRFFILLVLLAFAILLSDAVQYLVYLAFFRVDFSHARIAITALLPLCVLAGVFVHELFGDQRRHGAAADRSAMLALVAGGAVAVAGVLSIDALAPATATVLFGTTVAVEIGNAYRASGHELARALLTVAVFLAGLGLNWFARHVEVAGVAGRLTARWHDQRGKVGATVWRLAPAYALGGLMIAQAFGGAYFRLNGDHAWTYPVPFLDNNSFSPPPDVLVPPGPAARQTVRERLETDRYRAVTVSAADGYPTYDVHQSERGYSAFVAPFWQLRLANGYPVLTRREAELPWPEASKTLRAISFGDQRTLPWPLLAALNVKYAVVASPSLMFNVPADPARRGADAGPDDLTILENPLPVTPRVFFAETAVPRMVPAATTAPLPTRPGALRATALPEDDIALSWTGETSDATYQVHRRQVAPMPEPAGAQVAQTERGANGYVDRRLSPGTTFEYQVRACDRRGCGELSAPIEAQVAVASAAPRALAVAAQSASEATVTWEPADEEAATVLEMLTGAGAPTGPAAELPPGVRSYRLSGLRPLRDYAIRLRSCTADGCSPHTAPKRVSMPSALTAAELEGIIPADPTRESIVEGLEAPLVLVSAGGTIDADFREPDRLRIAVEPAEIERLLVVNELYHPSWHAYTNGPGGRTELKVWPTNVVMRGVLVPPGASEIELRFEPFILRWPALLPVLVGLLLGAAGWLGLRWLDRVRRAG